jgi:hypothetical protein
MTRCGDHAMSAKNRATPEVIVKAQVSAEDFSVEGEKTIGYGVVFETGKGSFRISDISLERAVAEEFARMIVEAADVPDYQVYELLDDFLGR